MKDEIKEILDEMINLKDYEDYKIYGKRANEIGKLLLDYITNLQEENERYKKNIDEAIKELEKLLPLCIMPNNTLIHATEKSKIIEETIKILKGE